MKIVTYKFNSQGLQEVDASDKGKDWPVVYLISNSNDLYVGETTSAANRMRQHLMNPVKRERNLSEIRIVFDDEYNKSVILDYEQNLVKCFKADGKYNVLNRNAGQSAAHEYYQRNLYRNKFADLWQKIREEKLAYKSLDILENESLFKYSPYTALTEEQNEISAEIINNICDDLENPNTPGSISLVNGCAGTGKTILAISIINSLINAVNLDESELSEDDQKSDKVQALLRLKKYLTSANGHTLRIGFVFPMPGIRQEIRRIFQQCGNGLTAEMVLSPYELRNRTFDVLFVDESHRLFRRKNLSNYPNFDDTCEALGMDKYTATQLDWVLKQGRTNILFYDQNQSIKGSDITHQQYKDSIEQSGKTIYKYGLQTQMRCEGGEPYISYVREIMNCTCSGFKEINNYDFQIFSDVDQMISKIRELDDSVGLCRTVAGYSWPWNTKPDNRRITYRDLVDQGKYDIDIEGNHYIWNMVQEGWISSVASKWTIGCIHTTQGFDLNYVGVIFGREIDYDPVRNMITIDLGKFYDTNVKRGCDEETVRQYIINTYTTMMARGIKGCYVYACNKNMQEYLRTYIKPYEKPIEIVNISGFKYAPIEEKIKGKVADANQKKDGFY